MKKELIEYQEELSPVPNHPVMISKYLLEQTKKYIKKEKNIKTTEELVIEERVILDALGHVLNFLNCDYKNRMDNDILEEQLNYQYIITLLFIFFASYPFEKEKKRVYSDTLTDQEVASILVTFLNEIVHENDYERTFTVRDLYQQYDYQDYQMKMLSLKAFLYKTSTYYKMLDAGITVDSLLKSYLEEEGIDHISKYGNCYYTKEMKELLGASEIEIPKLESERILKEIDALCYAYAKLSSRKSDLQKPKSKLIYARIKEMKRRT